GSVIVCSSSLLVLLLAPGCSSGGTPREQTETGTIPTASWRTPANRVFDPTSIYVAAGLFANGEPLPFVGDARFLAGQTPDTTLVLVTLSMANRVLTFSPEGDLQRAAYSVMVEVHTSGQPDTIIRRIVTQQFV